MASSTKNDGHHEDEIRLWREGDGWIAKDVDSGVTSQGDTREAALDNLDDALALHRGEAGRPPTDAELRDLGIDPDENSTGDQEPPDVLDS